MSSTVAIVDDNMLNIESLVLLVKKMGLASVVFESPDELVRELDSISQLDVVFLDLEFPNHNGLMEIQTLKQHQRLQNVPIVAYTVHTSEQNEARDAGFHSFIGKPLSVSQFPDQLRRILNGEQVWEVN